MGRQAEMIRQLNRKKGFTLMELMAAALIIVLISTAILVTFLSCIALSRSSRNTTIALSEGRLILEQMRNTLDTAATGLVAMQAAWPNGFTTLGNNVLTNEQITIAYAGTDPLQATLTVRWADGQRQRLIQLVTLLSQR